MQSLKLRPEFLAKHMRATAIELCNRQNSGWAQRSDPAELLEITYPTADVQRALEAVSTAAGGRPVVFIGQVLSPFTGHVGCPVDVLIKDGDQIGPLQVIGTPGHTPGHLVFYWPERKTLMTGDAFVTWPRVCPGWPNTMLNEPMTWDSLDRMIELDVEVISPGHGDPITSGGGEVMGQLAKSRHT